MAIFMIGYDLHAHRAGNYEALFSTLESIGTGYWDCLNSTWLVVSEKAAAEIRDELKQHLEDGDRLLVMRYDKDAAWLGFEGDCRTWLEDKL